MKLKLIENIYFPDIYRQTKYVDNFLPGISSITTAFEQKKYSIMKLQCEKYGLRAQTTGFFTLGCWFMTLADVIECSTKVGREIKFTPAVAQSHAMTNNWNISSKDVVSSMYAVSSDADSGRSPATRPNAWPVDQSKKGSVEASVNENEVSKFESLELEEYTDDDHRTHDHHSNHHHSNHHNNHAHSEKNGLPNMVRTKFIGNAAPANVAQIPAVHLSDEILETIGDMMISAEVREG